MLKKYRWILGLGIAWLALAPALRADEATKAKAAAPSGSSVTKSAVPEAKPEPTAKATEIASAAKEGKSKSGAGHKSPGLASGLAFFPGIAIHGAGHMYAGSWMKGLGLLTIQGAAIGIAAATISGGTSDIETLSKGLSNGKFPTDVSAAYSKSGILIVSTMAILWTWFDDMAGAAIATNEYNKLVDEENQAHLRLQPRLDGVELALSTEF